MANYEAMTVAELEDTKAALKAGVRAAKEEMRLIEHEFLRPRRMQELAEQALRNAGVTGVTIAPEPSTIAATGADMGGDE